jgi:hypothetical protein
MKRRQQLPSFWFKDMDGVQSKIKRIGRRKNAGKDRINRDHLWVHVQRKNGRNDSPAQAGANREAKCAGI